MRENPRQPPNNTLLVFTRHPTPGKAKTRLIKALGEIGAALLQRRLTEKTIATALAADAGRVEIHYTGAGEEEMRAWLGPDLPLAYQQGESLGERLAAAADNAFAKGAGLVAIIGADCPELDADDIRRAFSLLAPHDLVIGPAHDGGYYLIAMKANNPEIFTGVTLGRADTLAQTVETANRLGLSAAMLTIKNDIDRPEDLDLPEAKKLISL